MKYFYWFYDKTDYVDAVNSEASLVICPNNDNVWYIPGTISL